MSSSCGFKSLVSGTCGASKYSKGTGKTVALSSCNKDIEGHLKGLNTFRIDSVKSEAILILSRAGIFEVDDSHLKLKICPRHRDELGIRWKTNRRYCACPTEWAPHKTTARKKERGISLEHSRILYDETGIVLPVGSPICKRCRSLLEEKSSARQAQPKICVSSPDDNSSDHEVSFDKTSEPSTSYHDTSTETLLCEKFENLKLLPSPNQSLYEPDAGSSSENSGSTESGNGLGDLSKRRNTLNKFLAASGVETVTQSKKKFSNSTQRTQNVHVFKASESIVALLDVIAPEDCGALWDAVKRSRLVEKQLSLEKDDMTEDMYLKALAVTYHHATGWDTRRQVLSIMADLTTFSKLQLYIPGITKYRVKAARRHMELYGRGAAVISKGSTRMRVNEDQLDHLLTFITSPHVVQDLPFGQRTLKLSNGQVIETPNVIRNMIKERTIKQYVQYCDETSFKPFSYSTIHRILSSCSASVRKSLQGLDYISAEGATAFDDLSKIVDKLSDHGLDQRIALSYQQSLKQEKQYLKTDYKVHITSSAKIADHCLSFSLSDAAEEALQSDCTHTHDEFCYSCEQLKITCLEIGEQIKRLCKDDDDMVYLHDQAVKNIESWKSHLIRSVQQDKARTDVLEMLDEESVLITQDWAMKFLPQKYREHQRDWFGKRGISWHISVVVRKVQKVLQHQTLIHIVKNSTQESETVGWIMEHVLRTIKKDHPEIKTAYFRQDNAGCYHSVSLLTACPKISASTGIHIKRVDFSDPQGGKGACDRKAATVKGHVRRYINEGNDVESVEEFKKAILSHGGLSGVRVALVDDPKFRYNILGKWDGISSLNNFLYDDNDTSVTVWKSYDIGHGRKVLWSKLPVQVLETTNEQADVSFSLGDFMNSDFSCQPSNESNVDDSTNEEDDEEDDSTDQTSGELFSCPSQGCVMSFKRYANLESHLAYGKCKLRKETFTLLDKAKMLYAQKLDEGTSLQPHLCTRTTASRNSLELDKGWALRKSKKSGRFNDNQRKYLDEKFEIGLSTGIKCDPSQVARDLRHARKDTGERRFTMEEFLSPQQIKSYFSRKATKTKQGLLKYKEVKQVNEVDALSVEEQMSYTSVRDDIIEEFQLTHPITYDTYNICELHSKDKLKSLNVSLLIDICNYFHFDIEGLSKHRKKGYLVLINDLVTTCSCKH